MADDDPWSEAGPDAASWQDAARQGNLLSYAWHNRPSLDDLAMVGHQPEWPDWANTALQAASVPVNLLTAPARLGGEALSDWMEGRQGPETLNKITGATLGMGGLSAPIEAPASLRVFGGPSARTADLDALARAKSYVAAGQPAEHVWEGTGWFQDKDGRWKFEIPDHEANTFELAKNPNPEDKFNYYKDTNEPVLTSEGKIKVPINGENPARLGDLLDHPDLYAAYPDAESIALTGHAKGSEGWYNATAHDRSPMIGLSQLEPNDAVSVLLHEVQHHIQNVEGFAQGGNPEQFLPEGHVEQSKFVNSLYDIHADELRKAGINVSAVESGMKKLDTGEEPNSFEQQHLQKAQSYLSPGDFNDFANLLAKRRVLKAASAAAYEKYSSLAGEVEARNVQERDAQQTPTHVFPWATPGYPQGEQIIRKVRPEPETSTPTPPP